MGFPWEHITDYSAYYADWQEGVRYLSAVTLLTAALILLWYRRRAAWGWSPLYAILLAAMFCQALWVANVFPDDGDAAQYLLVTHSLARDGDLDLDNNLARQDYRHFRWPWYHFGGAHITRSDGRAMSWHEPALPFILLPGYRLGGRLGAMLTLNLSWLLAVYAARQLTAAIVPDKRAQLFALAAVFLSSPLLLFAHIAFSEIAAAAAVAAAARLAYTGREFRGRALLLVLLLALLPLLNTRFGLISAGLVIFMLLDRKFPRRQTLALAGTALLLYFSLNLLLLGRLLPFVLTMYQLGERFTMAIFVSGIFGLLLDRELGLFIYAPVYAAALFAWPRLCHHRRYLLLLALAALPYVLQSAAYYEWNANIAGGPRYLVAVLPLITPLMAIAWQRLAGRPWRRLLLTGLATISFTIALGHLLIPALIYGPLVGRGIPQPFVKINELRSSTVYRWLPSFSPHRLVP